MSLEDDGLVPRSLLDDQRKIIAEQRQLIEDQRRIIKQQRSGFGTPGFIRQTTSDPSETSSTLSGSSRHSLPVTSVSSDSASHSESPLQLSHPASGKDPQLVEGALSTFAPSPRHADPWRKLADLAGVLPASVEAAVAAPLTSASLSRAWEDQLDTTVPIGQASGDLQRSACFGKLSASLATEENHKTPHHSRSQSGSRPPEFDRLSARTSSAPFEGTADASLLGPASQPGNSNLQFLSMLDQLLPAAAAPTTARDQLAATLPSPSAPLPQVQAGVVSNAEVTTGCENVRLGGMNAKEVCFPAQCLPRSQVGLEDHLAVTLPVGAVACSFAHLRPDPLMATLPSGECSSTTPCPDASDGAESRDMLLLAEALAEACRGSQRLSSPPSSARGEEPRSATLSTSRQATRITPHVDNELSSTEAVLHRELWKVDLGAWVLDANVSKRGRWLCTASENKIARIYDIVSRSMLQSFEHDGWVWSAQFDPDGLLLCTAAGDGFARVFDVETGKTIHKLQHGDVVKAASFSVCGKFLLTASQDRFARVFDAGSGQVAREIEHTGWVLAAAWSPEGNLFCTASDDFCARLFDAETGEQQHEFKHNDWLRSVAFSPDGRKLCTASDDRYVRIFDVDSRKEISKFEHTASVACAGFSPDGHWLCTACDDHAYIFDMIASKELLRFNHGARVCSASFSLDGRRLCTGSEDGHVRVFGYALQSMLSSLRPRQP